MPTTLSHFANITGLTLGTTAVGSSSNLRIEKTIVPVEGTDNAIIGGATTHHVVGRHYRFSFETNDVSALTALATTATTTAQSLTCQWVASSLQPGTPMATQTLTLTNCIIDNVSISPETKALGKYTVTGHTMAATADADNFTIA